MKQAVKAAVAGGVMLAFASPALAAGNLAANGTDLPALSIDTTKLAFSQTTYELETGKYYRLQISSDGGDEIDFAAPEMWRNAWINNVSVEDVSISTSAIDEISFDDEATVEISFVPIRPGEYPFYAPGYENRGLLGKFVVK